MTLTSAPLTTTLDLREKIEKLTAIGIALSSEHNLRALLELIVKEARSFTQADGASLYIKEKGKLKFVISQTASMKEHNGRNGSFSTYYLPITKESIAGHVALTGELLNIRDVYNISPDLGYRFNKDFDNRTGYRSKSMLAVPMRDHDDEIIGVLQLINSLDECGEVTTFDFEYERIILSLASQAAVAIRNVWLIEDIRKLFRSLVRYSAKAIDARSPQTAGHSGRVARFSVRIALAINEESEGRLGRMHFTAQQIEELRMAGWLHDIGKIGVSESILEKANKLPNEHLDVIRERFEVIKSWIKNRFLLEKIKFLSKERAASGEIKVLEAQMQHELQTTDRELLFIEQVNIPGRFCDDDQKRLHLIAKKQYENSQGTKLAYLTEKEHANLSIVKGNLTEDEYRVMQSHVEHTIGILNKIPFTKDLENIPSFAAAHHEYLDGSGYPKGLKGDEIPIQVRIMCIADIFDALRSPDRPYKKPLKLSKTLEVLKSEAKDGKLDRDIVDLFIYKKVYQRKPRDDDED